MILTMYGVYANWLKNSSIRVTPCLIATALLSTTLPALAQTQLAQTPLDQTQAPPAKTSGQYIFNNNPEVQAFIQMMRDAHGFKEADLVKAFAQTKHQPDAQRFMAPPSVHFKKSWGVYRSRYLDALRIEEGLKFWQQHRATLQRAQDTYGVPAEIIVAIIGVETVYGRVTGNFRVMDALATLAFDYPRRAAFFKEELEQFMLLAREQNVDLLSVRGSFAGAIGLPQFMPGSIRRHAVDFNQDGHIDLRGSATDAIGSVGNFLLNHGWQTGKPTHQVVTVEQSPSLNNPLIAEQLSAGIKPHTSIERLTQSGVKFADAAVTDVGDQWVLIGFPTPDMPTQYIAASNNFYVVTRYNQSSFYALAVIDLASALKEKRSK